MKNNLVWIKTANGGYAPAIAFEKNVIEKIGHLIARNTREFHDNPKRCVIPEYDSVQPEPILRSSDSYGYDTLLGAVVSVLTGWHFIKSFVRPLYYANSEGLRLIAKYGSPRRAYASLGN